VAFLKLCDSIEGSILLSPWHLGDLVNSLAILAQSLLRCVWHSTDLLTRTDSLHALGSRGLDLSPHTWPFLPPHLLSCCRDAVMSNCNGVSSVSLLCHFESSLVFV